ncbi:hypothetical protein [Nocardioides perillae]|uniref:F0F1-type ATP synthase membrane subunit c/vacuolar-type H+-ATPase subunit K n=1 Tax=Nocardioides perillae TaxID=1119534 RepID=A0A7Y9UKK4_9ACTN|nr:hypothetical protein [Nocardioides perillae]NYG54057.1 F0F1-type ATP synthase membrane subunit c/vacuolar-type H+-ATPase subunit K [Nocardioides perillae]
MPAPHAVRRLLAVGALLALGATSACSGDEPAADGPESSAAPTLAQADLARGLADLYAGAGTGRAGTAAAEQAAREATCFGEVLARAVPASTLGEAGLVVDGAVVEQAPVLPEQLARQWFAAQQACADFVAVSTRAQVAATKGRLDREAYAGCLRGTLDAATIEEAVVATLTARWDDPAVAALGDAQATCARGALPPE